MIDVLEGPGFILCFFIDRRISSNFFSFSLHHLIVLGVGHEYQRFRLSKNPFLIEKYEILKRCRFSRKMHPFMMCANFLTLFYIFHFKTTFSDSVLETE
jgi:hypothetical protein